MENINTDQIHTAGANPFAGWMMLPVVLAILITLSLITSLASSMSITLRVILSCLIFIISTVYMSLGLPALQRRLQLLSPLSAALYSILGFFSLCVPYLAFAESSSTLLKWGILLAAILAIPYLFYLGRARSKPAVTDLLAILLIWAPIEFKLFPYLQIPVEGYRPFNLIHILILPFVIWNILFIRKWADLSYSLFLSGKDWGIILSALALFTIIGLPLGLGLGFLSITVTDLSFIEISTRIVLIWALVALPEEIFFRGLIQTGLSKLLSSSVSALICTSVLFGLTHINNTQHKFAYALLATLAGICYGWAYNRTHNAVASSVVHTAVNSVWFLFLGWGK